MEEESFLKQWFEDRQELVAVADWKDCQLISAHTAEHEVRYREDDHRAVKRTWPGTFGNIPAELDGQWKPAPATPRQYLHRQALQNELFCDEIVLEGAMIDDRPSMIIGQPAGGLSLVISQPWLDASNPECPHPDEAEIAALLKDRGFEPIFASLYGWKSTDDGWILLDAKPDNFIATAAGILPIDLLLTETFLAA